MQHAGIQYGPGGAPTLLQSAHYASPDNAASVPNGGGTTTTSLLRSWRKKDASNTEKLPPLPPTEPPPAISAIENQGPVARVAPHAHYPKQSSGDAYRFQQQQQQYGDYSLPQAPQAPVPVKYSEIIEPMQGLEHLSSVVAKPKEKSYVEMCNIPQQQQHSGGYKPYQNAPAMQYKDQFHPYMQKESQMPNYGQKDGNFPQYYKMQNQYPRPYRENNDFLASLNKIAPQMAQDILNDPHLRESQFPSVYHGLEQNRLYQQQQRMYQRTSPIHPTPGYVQRNLPHNYNQYAMSQQKLQPDSYRFHQYPTARYPHEQTVPRHQYPAEMNFAPLPSRISPSFPPCSQLEYSQHYQHRQAPVRPDYLSISGKATYLDNHPEIPEIVPEESIRPPTKTLKRFLETWSEDHAVAEEVESTQQDKVQPSKPNRENTLYVLDAMEISSENVPQYLHLQSIDKLPCNIRGFYSNDPTKDPVPSKSDEQTAKSTESDKDVASAQGDGKEESDTVIKSLPDLSFPNADEPPRSEKNIQCDLITSGVEEKSPAVTNEEADRQGSENDREASEGEETGDDSDELVSSSSYSDSSCDSESKDSSDDATVIEKVSVARRKVKTAAEKKHGDNPYFDQIRPNSKQEECALNLSKDHDEPKDTPPRASDNNNEPQFQSIHEDDTKDDLTYSEGQEKILSKDEDVVEDIDPRKLEDEVEAPIRECQVEETIAKECPNTSENTSDDWVKASIEETKPQEVIIETKPEEVIIETNKSDDDQFTENADNAEIESESKKGEEKQKICDVDAESEEPECELNSPKDLGDEEQDRENFGVVEEICDEDEEHSASSDPDEVLDENASEETCDPKDNLSPQDVCSETQVVFEEDSEESASDASFMLQIAKELLQFKIIEENGRKVISITPLTTVKVVVNSNSSDEEEPNAIGDVSWAEEEEDAGLEGDESEGAINLEVNFPVEDDIEMTVEIEAAEEPLTAEVNEVLFESESCESRDEDETNKPDVAKVVRDPIEGYVTMTEIVQEENVTVTRPVVNTGAVATITTSPDGYEDEQSCRVTVHNFVDDINDMPKLQPFESDEILNEYEMPDALGNPEVPIETEALPPKDAAEEVKFRKSKTPNLLALRQYRRKTTDSEPEPGNHKRMRVKCTVELDKINDISKQNQTPKAKKKVTFKLDENDRVAPNLKQEEEKIVIPKSTIAASTSNVARSLWKNAVRNEKIFTLARSLSEENKNDNKRRLSLEEYIKRKKKLVRPQDTTATVPVSSSSEEMSEAKKCLEEKLNSLELFLPKITKLAPPQRNSAQEEVSRKLEELLAENPITFEPGSSSERALIRRFLNRECLKPDEVRKVRQIVQYKRALEQMKARKPDATAKRRYSCDLSKSVVIDFKDFENPPNVSTIKFTDRELHESILSLSYSGTETKRPEATPPPAITPKDPTEALLSCRTQPNLADQGDDPKHGDSVVRGESKENDNVQPKPLDGCSVSTQPTEPKDKMPQNEVQPETKQSTGTESVPRNSCETQVDHCNKDQPKSSKDVIGTENAQPKSSETGSKLKSVVRSESKEKSIESATKYNSTKTSASKPKSQISLKYHSNAQPNSSEFSSKSKGFESRKKLSQNDCKPKVVQPKSSNCDKPKSGEPKTFDCVNHNKSASRTEPKEQPRTDGDPPIKQTGNAQPKPPESKSESKLTTSRTFGIIPQPNSVSPDELLKPKIHEPQPTTVKEKPRPKYREFQSSDQPKFREVQSAGSSKTETKVSEVTSQPKLPVPRGAAVVSPHDMKTRLNALLNLYKKQVQAINENYKSIDIENLRKVEEIIQKLTTPNLISGEVAYEIRRPDLEKANHNIKIHLKKVDNRKRRKRFRNLYSGNDSDDDESPKAKEPKLNGDGEAIDYSVHQRNSPAGVPKLIIKRRKSEFKADLQPFVKLIRTPSIDSLVKKRKRTIKLLPPR